MDNIILNERLKGNNHRAKRLRKKGKIPGVIYGLKKSNILFEIGEIDFNNELNKCGEHGIINFEINNNKGTGLIKDVSRDPVTHRILNIDIEEIDDKKDVLAEVPIIYEGVDYLISKGAVLQKERDVVKVNCKTKDMPKNIKFNVGRGTNGDVYRLSDLEVADEICILDDLNTVIASISNEKRVISDEMKQN